MFKSEKTLRTVIGLFLFIRAIDQILRSLMFYFAIKDAEKLAPYSKLVNQPFWTKNYIIILWIMITGVLAFVAGILIFKGKRLGWSLSASLMYSYSLFFILSLISLFYVDQKMLLVRIFYTILGLFSSILFVQLMRKLTRSVFNVRTQDWIVFFSLGLLFTVAFIYQTL